MPFHGDVESMQHLPGCKILAELLSTAETNGKGKKPKSQEKTKTEVPMLELTPAKRKRSRQQATEVKKGSKSALSDDLTMSAPVTRSRRRRNAD